MMLLQEECQLLKPSIQGSYRSWKTGKSRGICGSWKGHGKILFFEKSE